MIEKLLQSANAGLRRDELEFFYPLKERMIVLTFGLTIMTTKETELKAISLIVEAFELISNDHFCALRIFKYSEMLMQTIVSEEFVDRWHKIIDESGKEIEDIMEKLDIVKNSIDKIERTSDKIKSTL